MKWALLPLAVALTACPSEDVGDDRGRVGDPCGSSVGECRDDLVCVLGFCRQACVTNADCPSLDVCDDGVCLDLDEYCSLLDNVGITEVDASGAARACIIETCEPGWEDFDGEWQNGCERICAPTGPERCNGADDDCSGVIDDLDDVNADCAARFSSATGVAEWECTGVCELAACAAGSWDANGAKADGCELQCTATGPEVCDGVDNNCNGAIDDVPATTLATECAAELPDAEHVETWSCVAATCVVEQCASGWSDISGGAADGCEALCTPTDPADEVCDALDNDCDGVTDPRDAPGCTLYYRDTDGDGLGGGDAECLCAASATHTVTAAGDCDELLASCTTDCTTDADQDGAVDCADTCVDWDGDGYGEPGGLGDDCLGSDCDDVPADCGVLCHPGLEEICDGHDNDCADGVDAPLGPAPVCSQQLGVCAGTVSPACDGASGWRPCDASIYQAWAQAQHGVDYETNENNDCDFFDNDCDGTVDDGCELAVEVFDRDNTILQPDDVVALAVDADGNLWVANNDNELFYLPLGASDFEEITLVTPAGPITALETDAAGNAWIGFETTCRDEDDNDPPCDCGAWRIFADRSSAEFLCTEGLSLRNNWVMSLAADDTGRVYLGTADDVAVYFPPPDDVVACDLNTSTAEVHSMALDTNSPGRLFVGLRNDDIGGFQLGDLTGPSSCDATYELDDLPVSANDIVAVDFWDHGTPADRTDDVLGLGSSGNWMEESFLGIYRIDNRNLVRDWPDSISAVVFDRTRGWLFAGGENEGLYLIRDVDSPARERYEQGDGLPDEDVSALAFDHGHSILWVGTAQGVARMAIYR